MDNILESSVIDIVIAPPLNEGHVPLVVKNEPVNLESFNGLTTGEQTVYTINLYTITFNDTHLVWGYASKELRDRDIVRIYMSIETSVTEKHDSLIHELELYNELINTATVLGLSYPEEWDVREEALKYEITETEPLL